MPRFDEPDVTAEDILAATTLCGAGSIYLDRSVKCDRPQHNDENHSRGGNLTWTK